MPKGICLNKKSELNRKIRMKNLRLSNIGKIRTIEQRNKISETRKRLFKEGKIKPNSGCYDHISKEIIDKMSKTKKKLYREGKLKGCFKKGNIPHNTGKTKENYEPLNNVSKKLMNRNITENWRMKMSAAKQEIHLSEWKGFSSFEPYDKNWNNKFKRAIRKRDNQICMLCGIHREKLSRALDVHHINYNKKLTIPQNCISLCVKCHRLTAFNRKYYIIFFQSLLSNKYNYTYSENKEVIRYVIK